MGFCTRSDTWVWGRARRGILAILLVGALAPTTEPATAPTTAPYLSPFAPVVVADFDRPVPAVHSMVGFLHGCDQTTPPDEMLLPLRPALWRIGFMWMKNRDRIAKLGIPIIMVLGDSWKKPKTLTDLSDWDSYADMTIKQAEGRQHTWDVFNEPDLTEFSRHAPEKYYEVYVDAEHTLRRELGEKTLVSGPSLSHYDAKYIADFLDYCKAHGSKVDVLAWHELNDDRNVHDVTAHLLDARKRFINNPAYESLGIQRIEINEIVGRSAQYFACEILGYFDALEKGGADGACKGCWHDSKGKSNCSNNSLDGIVTPDNSKPRAAWWAYKAYADTVATRVASRSSDPCIISFAAAGDATAATMIVARVQIDGVQSDADRPANVRLTGLKSLPFVEESRRIQVRIENIPNAGEAAVERLAVVSEQDVTVGHGTANFALPPLAEHEADVITLTRTP